MQMDSKLNDQLRETKFDLVLDLIDHPEQYAPDKIKEIMADPEAREIYNLLCKADSAIADSADIDVEAEWVAFDRTHRPARRFMPRWFGSRAASISAIIGTSLAAVAAGIAVTVAVADSKPEIETGIDNAEPARTTVISADATIVLPDTTKAEPTPLLFEDEPLGVIMQSVANTYGVEVRFNNAEVADLHLYYKFNPSLTLDEVLSQLNTFEQINIQRQGQTITID